MRKLWLKFLGGFFVFSVIMYIVVLGFIKIGEFLEESFSPEGIPYLLRIGLVLIGVFITVAVLNWTTGESYKQLIDIRNQKIKNKKNKDSSIP